MSLLPQINNEINSSVKTEVTLPSKTYRLKVDSTALQLQKGNKTTVSGSEIKLTDVKFTQENKTSIKLEGSTNQVTRSGKNLCDDRFSSYAISSYGYKKIIDRSVSLTATLIDKDTSVDLSGVYFGFTGNGENANAGVAWLVQNGSKSNISTNLNLQYLSFFPANETTFNKIFSRYYIQIEEGEASTYEPYGASPSPDYPSPIENVEGKNKFDINQEKEIFNIMLYKYSYYLKPNTKYTISSNCPASTTANIYANSNSSNGAVYINKNQTIQSDENGYFYILVRYKAYASDSSTFNLYEKVLNGTYYIQLEEGTVATPYVPYNSLELKVTNGLEETDENYQEQVATFPLGEEKLMEGSYLADDGIHHKRRQRIFDGTETDWSIRVDISNENYTVFRQNKYVAGSGLVTNSNGFSSHFKVEKASNTTTDNVRFINTNHYGICFTVSTSIASTVDEWKTYLAEQYANGTPVIVEYELAEEEIVPYTTAQQEAYNQLNDYELFDGVNYITMISTIPGTLSLAYYDKNNINLIKTEEDRIVGFVDNLEAIKQSIYHILSIERYAYLIYDDNYGVEFEQYIGKDFDYINATIENTLQEALLYDLRILDVSVDNIEQIDINKVAINFTVDTIYGNLVMEVSIDV